MSNQTETTKTEAAPKQAARDTDGTAAVPPTTTRKVGRLVDHEIVHALPLADCFVSELNTRQPKPADVKELAESMRSRKASGQAPQTTPAIVRPHPKQKGKYEIGAGARRKVAAEAAGLATLAAVIRELNDSDFEELILVENLQREDPDPKAEVELLDRLVKRGIATADQVSAHLGKPASWAARRLQLLKVVPELRKEWNRPGQNGLSHFTVDMMGLLGTLPPDMQKAVVGRDAWWVRNCTSRADLKRKLEEHVLCRLDQAPFDLNDPRFFVKGCGPGCACDSSALGALFADGAKEPARCLNKACFNSRCALATKVRFDELRKGEDLAVVSTNYNAPDVLDIGGKRVKVENLSYRGLGKLPEKAEKGTKVIVVGEQGKMRIGYLPPKGSGKKGHTPKAPATALAERKKILQGKRWQLVHTDLLKALRESKATQVTENIVDLVTIFGLPYHAPARNRLAREWSRFDEIKVKGYPVGGDRALSYDKQRDAALWEGVKDVLEQVMSPGFRVGDVPDSAGDMQRVAKLISFPIAEKKREADLKVLPPKTWGKVDPHTLEPVKGAEQKQLGKATEKHVRGKADSGKLKAEKKPAKPFTAEGRKKLAAAMKARWAARRKDAQKKVSRNNRSAVS